MISEIYSLLDLPSLFYRYFPIVNTRSGYSSTMNVLRKYKPRKPRTYLASTLHTWHLLLSCIDFSHSKHSKAGGYSTANILRKYKPRKSRTSLRSKLFTWEFPRSRIDFSQLGCRSTRKFLRKCKLRKIRTSLVGTLLTWGLRTCIDFFPKQVVLPRTSFENAKRENLVLPL